MVFDGLDSELGEEEKPESKEAERKEGQGLAEEGKKLSDHGIIC